jgi:hypothetical protein
VKSSILLSEISKIPQLSELMKYLMSFNFEISVGQELLCNFNFFIPITSFETAIDTKPKQLGQ